MQTALIIALLCVLAAGLTGWIKYAMNCWQQRREAALRAALRKLSEPDPSLFLERFRASYYSAKQDSALSQVQGELNAAQWESSSVQS